MLSCVDAKFAPTVADALTGQFLAARDGLALPAQHGLERIVLECDNLSLINMIRAGNGDWSTVYGIWQEIQELGRSFVSLEFSFVHREGNRAAHMCASLPSLLEPELFWLDCFPAPLPEGGGD